MSQPDDDYQPIPAHAIYLLAMCISVTAAFVLLLFDLSDEFSIPRGAYALLAAAIVVFGAGYLVRSEGYRVSRRQDAAVAELRKLAPREPHRPTLGRVYTARPDLGDTITLPPVGLDAESIQAARSIARDLLNQKHP